MINNIRASFSIGFSRCQRKRIDPAVGIATWRRRCSKPYLLKESRLSASRKFAQVSFVRSRPNHSVRPLQIGHYRQELLLLPQENLITHLPQCRSPSPLRPALQLSQVDRPYGARGQAKLPGHSSYRRALTGLSNCLLKTLLNRRLLGNSGTFLP